MSARRRRPSRQCALPPPPRREAERGARSASAAGAGANAEMTRRDRGAACGAMRNAAGLGLPEKEEDQCVVSKKILKLADLIRKAKSCVVLTGAGISTSAGVSDFRGPNGVWTAEKKGVAPPASKSFENVQPTLSVSRAPPAKTCLACGAGPGDLLAHGRAAHGNGRTCQSRLNQARHFPGSGSLRVPQGGSLSETKSLRARVGVSAARFFALLTLVTHIPIAGEASLTNPFFACCETERGRAPSALTASSRYAGRAARQPVHRDVRGQSNPLNQFTITSESLAKVASVSVTVLYWPRVAVVGGTCGCSCWPLA